MDLIWWVVAMAGCLALAGCVGLAVLWPRPVPRNHLRPLANTNRLTRLPEYLRAVRRRTLATVTMIVLLLVAFVASVLVAARPTGLPSWSRNAQSAAPEDVMVCIGGPQHSPGVAATLNYFADRITTFGTQRIGLTSANRRVVPLTRDYQYAAAQFADYAQPEGSPRLVAPVSYADYTQSVEDVLALCLTGFPSFDRKTDQRRSLVYVGPQASPSGSAPALFSADRVAELATTAGVQVNVLTTGATTGPMADLARDTGGQAYSADSDVTAHLERIHRNPPPAPSAAGAARSTESPEIPLLVALGAVVIVAIILVIRRRGGIRGSIRWRLGLLATAAVLLAIAVARPVIGGTTPPPAVAGGHDPSIFLLVDRSADMGISDRQGHTRLEVARDDIATLMDRYPNARFAVISFASRPSLNWPLSQDNWSLRSVVDALNPYASTSAQAAQTNVGAAATVLRYQLFSAVQQYPRAQNLVFYFGAGAPESQVPASIFDPPAGSVDGGAVLDYSATGEAALPAAASQLGVPLVTRTGDGPLNQWADNPVRDTPPAAVAATGLETYWIFAMGAAGLVLVELYLVLRQFGRTRLVTPQEST
jgi:hypothetical protein